MNCLAYNLLMSKTLVKLVDEAIIPALLLVLARIGGLTLSILIFGLNFNISELDNKLIPYGLIFQSTYDATLASSISSLLMIAVTATGFGYMIYKVSAFQDKRISPKKLLRLADRNLLSLIESSLSIYLKSLVWLIFMWITSILVITSASRQLTYIWIAVASTIISIIATLFLVKNIEMDYTESEAKIQKK